MKRQTWIAPVTLALVILLLGWQVGSWAVDRNNQAGAPAKPSPSASPTPHTLRFITEGQVDSATAQYVDSHGPAVGATIGGDIQVTGLTSAELAVAGTNITCYILLDGVTLAASASDGPITLCAWPTS